MRMLVLIVLFLAGDTKSLYAQSDTLTTLEALVAEWSQLRLNITDEQRSWDERKKQLHAEIALLRKEKDALEEEINQATLAEESFKADRLEALRDKERLSLMLDGLPVLIDSAEASLRAWPDRLPPPLREPLESAFRPLMRDSTQGRTLTDAARLQRVVALYTEIEKLQHDIHVVKEVLTMPDGSRKEADVCYLGLARAFAVSPDYAWAAVGSPSAQGWHWEQRREIADRVREAISIFNREQTATLVELPLAVQEASE
jgi:hypothetical protein